MSAKVSVLVPLYNSEEWIEKTILSVINQTYTNIELIIVDDGSVDNSLSIAKKFESENIKVFTQINSGACAARNKAFSKSTGDYIQYLDADDILSNDKIANQMKLLASADKKDVALCKWSKFTTNLSENSAKLQLSDQNYNVGYEWLVDSWNSTSMSIPSVWLTSRNLIESSGKWNESLLINQDGEFFCRILLNASRIYFDDLSVVYYRTGNDQSVSSNSNTLPKAKSLLRSYILYHQHSIAAKKVNQLESGLIENYIQFLYRYDKKFPQLSAQVFYNLKRLGAENPRVKSNILFGKIARIIGFKGALWVKRLIM